MSDENVQPVVEDPTIVIGGPGGGPVPDPKADTATQDKPIYTGLVGDLKSVEDLVSYARNLETIMTAKGATGTAEPAKSFAPPAPNQAKPTEAPKFSDVIYNDPVAAEELLLRKVDERQQRRDQAERMRQNYWNGFYDKNPDLKQVQHVVQSIFERDENKILTLPNDAAVTEHLVKESRKIVDEVRKTIGVTETQLGSGPAVTVGSGSASYPITVKQEKPKNFLEQLTGARAGRGKLKSRGNS